MTSHTQTEKNNAHFSRTSFGENPESFHSSRHRCLLLDINFSKNLSKDLFFIIENINFHEISKPITPTLMKCFPEQFLENCQG